MSRVSDRSGPSMTTVTLRNAPWSRVENMPKPPPFQGVKAAVRVSMICDAATVTRRHAGKVQRTVCTNVAASLDRPRAASIPQKAPGHQGEIVKDHATVCARRERGSVASPTGGLGSRAATIRGSRAEVENPWDVAAWGCLCSQPMPPAAHVEWLGD